MADGVHGLKDRGFLRRRVTFFPGRPMDRLVTKTLAEIYLQQGHLDEAYSIFKILSERDPENVELKNRLKELEEELSLSRSTQLTPPAPKKIQNLEKWLDHIRERRKP